MSGNLHLTGGESRALSANAGTNSLHEMPHNRAFSAVSLPKVTTFLAGGSVIPEFNNSGMTNGVPQTAGAAG